MKVLVLGMFFSDEHLIPSRGQGYRDQARLCRLEANGYTVYSLDNKHTEKGQHCKANFVERVFDSKSSCSITFSLRNHGLVIEGGLIFSR